MEKMEKQLILSVSREYGSGGHVIARGLADIFGLPVYDYNILSKISSERNLAAGSLEKYDEVPRNRIFTRNVRGYSNSLEENIANLQFEYLKKKAASGESFVVVGRCSETVLREYDCMIPIFVMADEEFKIRREMQAKQISRTEAEKAVCYYNKKRKEYHNYYCSGKWGDSRYYDVCINSAKLGLEQTTKLLAEYIRERMAQ